MNQLPSSSGEKPQPPQPQTPPGKQILPFPESQFTPDALYRLSTLKRKASEASLDAPPKADSGYIKWRILVIRAELDYIKGRRDSMKEAFRNSKLSQIEYEKYRGITIDDQEELEKEERRLLGQGKFIEEDLQDSVANAEGAYIEDLYLSWRHASSDGQKNTKKEKSLSRNKFNNGVVQYLGAERVVGDDIERFCSVLGIWIENSYVKCAHIVPRSFETKNLAYIFGANDAALASVRNGIIMANAIEAAFDNGWVTIVPDGSVEATPTQWKFVVLNDSLREKTVYTQSGKIWRLGELHNRELTWQNDNRPARRYLYFRYVMAIMHAEFNGWDGYRDKVPPGKIWASPNKPEGYLRKSVLRSLARVVHDKDILPEDLIEAGGFNDTDPPTGTDTANRLAELELGMEMRRECKVKSMNPHDDEDSEEEE